MVSFYGELSHAQEKCSYAKTKPDDIFVLVWHVYKQKVQHVGQSQQLVHSNYDTQGFLKCQIF